MDVLRFIFFWYWAFCFALLGRRDDDFTLFQAVVRLPHPGSTFPGGRYRAVAPPVVGVRSDPPDSTQKRGGGGSNHKGASKGQAGNTKAARAHGEPSSGGPTKQTRGGWGAQNAGGKRRKKKRGWRENQ